MTITILDLENWTAGEATAELLRKRLSVRLTFRLTNAKVIPSLATIGKPNKHGIVPTLMAVEYGKWDDRPWDITCLRVYGHRADDPSSKEVNIYPHEMMGSKAIPAWIRDAAYQGMPDYKKVDE